MSGLAGIIAGAHALIALRMGEGHEHWNMTEADARRFAVAVGNVMRHYSLKASQSAIDHAALLFLAFEFEAPRFALSAQVKRMMAAAGQAGGPTPETAGATVYRFDGGNAS